MTAPGPSALISGIAGQDGSYLSETLRKRGWDVYGILRPGGNQCQSWTGADSPTFIERDLMDSEGIAEIVRDVSPDFIFHLGGISSVWQSWQDPTAVTKINAVSGVSLLDASMKLQERTGKVVTFVNASSAEIFGEAIEAPQSEETPLAPVSPYGASKALVHSLVQSFRSRGLAASNAILYNHESPRRPPAFVTRKITRAVAQISLGQLDSITLGNIEARRDWGWAPDYVDCIERIALAPFSDDYVVATGTSHSVAEFVSAAFACVGVDDWEKYVLVDDALQRPSDAVEMIGNSAKAESKLGWKATKSFEEIVESMVQHDIAWLSENS